MYELRFFSRLEYWVRSSQAAWLELLNKTNWLRSARKTQGLKGLDMAKKLGVSPARVSMLESDEARGAVTLRMMQKAAHALDCEFVYVLIPKKALYGNQPGSPKPKVRVRPGITED